MKEMFYKFYLWLYGIGHMVKEHSAEKKPTATTWATLSD